MALKVSREDVWAAEIEDRAGGLAEKLGVLADAGANLEFVIARRCSNKQGVGVVFVTPIRGAAQLRAAKKAGFQKCESMNGVRVEASDRPGLGAGIARAIGDACISMRGFSGAVMGKKCVFNLAFDSPNDASRAVRVLKKLT